MRTRDQLNAYIEQLERRLRLGALLRGGAILTSVALTVTVVLVLIANALAFSAWSLTGARVVLFVALAFAVGFGLALPLYGLDRRRTSGKAEQSFPQFQQRLITFVERDAAAPREPFLDLLAADTLEMARDAEPRRLVTDGRLLSSLAAGVASLGVLIWIIVAGPGYLGHGAALLWMGNPHGAAPLYDIRVSPGNAAVRRNTDQIVTAQLVGLQTTNVHLYARYQSASKWEQVVMQPQQGGSGFQFLFAGLPEAVEYYVEAGPLHSPHFNLRVVDLPAVKQIKVTYRFPAWTGMPSVVDEHGGDLRAVEGTDAELQISTDRPLRDGVLAVDDQQVHLSGSQGNVYTATVHMEKDGLYHVAALDQGQSVRLSGDYFIEARKANPPEVRITQPGRDYRSSPIEEVTVAVNAADEFGLGDVTLHYSVNGGPEKTASLLKQKGLKEADGSTMIALEDYKLVPGDLVSFYATAKDAHAESHTDMFFVQADPFEREFSQSQQDGGGGGGGGGGGQGNQTEISEREKQIIAATWNQQSNKSASKQETAETAKFLSDQQSKLRDQALSLAGRLERRELTEENQEFSDFQQDMNAAAGEMGPASEKLQQLKWNDAIPSEQKALQHLLRAEATFRQIQVAFGSRGGGGGGNGGAGRDLSSLFDLELDTEKNQYETGQNTSSASQRAQQIDEALQKLEELARRQQELAAQEQNSKQNLEQQRWQQEMLRRDAEELQRQMEQMARNQQSSSSQTGSQSGGQSQGQSGNQAGNQSGSSSSQGGTDSRVQQALDRLRQANDDMRNASSQQGQGQSEADARRAADRLREATDLLGGMRQQQGSGQVDALSREAERLSSEQRSQAGRMREAFGQDGQNGQKGTAGSADQAGSAAKREEQGKLADDRQRMADDLARLEKQMQDAERALGPGQRDASSKLRDALGGMDESDLKGRMQRSAEAIRRGLDPNSGEPAIAAGLQQLSDQLGQAQQATNKQQQGGVQEALDRVDRLRTQMEALSRDSNGPNGANGGQPGQRGQQGQQGQQGGQQGGQGQQGGPGSRNGNAGAQGGPAGGNGFAGGFRDGNYGGGTYQGGGRYYGYGDTGSYTSPTGTERQPTPVTQADIERAYQDAMRELNDLRQSVQGQPEPLADISELLREMQQLDPRRFPGNPAMVEELHAQVLATVDQLELKLRRQVDDKQAGQVRAGDSLPVPAGYQDAVAVTFAG